MTSIGETVSRRGIREILHFTTNKGLTGIFAERAVLSRERLPLSKYLEHVWTPNASMRKDGEWLDYVNLSISRINNEYFEHSSRWHENKELWWCALAFDPAILSDEDIFFANTNNTYSGCRRELGPAGLEALFAERIERWPGNCVTRETDMPESFTTCLQAEVLYPGELALDRLLRVYVATGPHADVAASNRAILLAKDGDTAGAASNIPIMIDPDVFEP